MFTKPNRKVDRVFLHCSASDVPGHDNIATIERWHRERGFKGIGYHLFISKDGKLHQGRSLERHPAAQAGNNTGTIAICCHGLDIKKFTEAQFDTLRALCVEINNAYRGEVTFHGHNEVAKKACPVFDHRAVLKLDRFGRLGLTGAKKKKLIDSDDRDPTVMPVLRRGDRGSAVVLLQQRLMLKADGIFGPKTDGHVRDFQTAHGLTRDGVVGKSTWKAILSTDRVEHFDN